MTLYEITRKLSGRRSNSDKSVRELDWGILTKPEEQLERWKEHFSRLLPGNRVEHPPDIEAGEELQINMGSITPEETSRAITKIKEENLTDQTTFCLMPSGKTLQHQHCSRTYERRNKSPEWKTGHIVKLPKKGDS